MLVGYVRVSTQDQNLDLPKDAPKKAGCERFFTDVASGANDECTGLVKAIAFTGPVGAPSGVKRVAVGIPGDLRWPLLPPKYKAPGSRHPDAHAWAEYQAVRPDEASDTVGVPRVPLYAGAIPFSS
jgi:hypothetical protein